MHLSMLLRSDMTNGHGMVHGGIAFALSDTAFAHPLGMSGARLVQTATEELRKRGGGAALCTMCIGVGQGIALAIEGTPSN